MVVLKCKSSEICEFCLKYEQHCGTQLLPCGDCNYSVKIRNELTEQGRSSMVDYLPDMHKAMGSVPRQTDTHPVHKQQQKANI